MVMVTITIATNTDLKNSLFVKAEVNTNCEDPLGFNCNNPAKLIYVIRNYNMNIERKVLVVG